MAKWTTLNFIVDSVSVQDYSIPTFQVHLLVFCPIKVNLNENEKQLIN